MGSLLQFSTVAGPVTHQLYISGDTLLVEELKEIPLRFPGIDTSVLHLGGTTLPGGLMVTMDARQGADLLELVAPSHGVPVHHGDYTVFKSPLSAFRAEVDRRGLTDRVSYLRPGQVIDLIPAATREGH